MFIRREMIDIVINYGPSSSKSASTDFNAAGMYIR